MFIYVFTVLWAALIFWGSSIPGSDFPQAPDITSYLVHFFEYLILGMLLSAASLKLKAKSAPPAADQPQAEKLKIKEVISSKILKLFSIVLLVGFLYALSDETHQLFVPGRNFEVLDLLVDAFGLVFGIFIVWLVRRNNISTDLYHPSTKV